MVYDFVSHCTIYRSNTFKMNYLKNREIAVTYKVSAGAVSKWVRKAKEKFIPLELVEVNGKTHIAKTDSNALILKELAQKGRKYKNKSILKTITPTEEFYKIFNERQIIEIITSLKIYKEIPMKYSYFNGGAKCWDEFVNKLLEENSPPSVPNYVQDTINQVRSNLNYITSLIEEYDEVNVVDLGVGNAVPVKELLDSLISKGLLRKYIGIDYSQQMLGIAESNLKKWFGKDFPFEGYIKDVSRQVFQDILYKNTHSSNKRCMNLVLFLGSSAANDRVYESSFNVIKESMGENDLFVLGHRLDTDLSKTSLAYTDVQSDPVKLEKKEKLMLDALGLTENFYDVERIYDQETRSRYRRIIPKLDLNIQFDTGEFKDTVSLPKNDHVTIWRYKHKNYEEIINTLTSVGFKIIQTSRSLSKERVLVIAGIKD